MMFSSDKPVSLRGDKLIKMAMRRNTKDTSIDFHKSTDRARNFGRETTYMKIKANPFDFETEEQMGI